MAGAIPILPTPHECDLIRRLKNWQLCVLLTTLDETGWRAAQDLLRDYARRPEYQQTETLGDTP
jgi:hypothetical protein